MFKKWKSLNPAAKTSIAYTVCNILQKSISFLTLPIFTRLLTTDQYGQFAVYTTWSAIFTILITLNLSFGTFDRAMIKFEGKRDQYTSSIHLIVLILSLVFVGIYLPLSGHINKLLTLSTPMVLLMVGEIIGVFAFHTWCSRQKFDYNWKGIVIITLSMAVAAPLLALLFVFNMTDRGYARILGYAIINIAVGLFFLVYNMVKGKVIFSKEFWKYALTFNIPLLPYYFSQIIFNQSDRIMIEKLVGLSEAGIYSVAYSFALVLSFVLTAINSGYVPWLYRGIKAKNFLANRSVSLGIAGLVGLMVAGLVWIAPEAMIVMAPEAYGEAVYVIPPVALSLVLLLYAQFAINIQFFYEEKWLLLLASVGAAGLNIGLNFWLIPIYGYLAAGYTTLASYVVFALFNFLFIIKKIRKGGDLYRIYNIWGLLIILLGSAALSFGGMFLYPYRWVRLGIVIGLAVVAIILIIVFWKKIKAFIKKFRAKDEAVEAENKPSEEEREEVSNESNQEDCQSNQR